ncbi:MAG TPA: phosphoglucosamine mutase [Thermoplasmata archaeon]|nr:phosphoglucosamine mutase [Thermoplasmata archaeon]
MTRLFGTNGIREVVGGPLTAPFVTRVAEAIASIVPPSRPIAVGWDGRTSSVPFARIVSATLALAGHRVVELGLLPTPAIQYNVPRVGAALGVIVTASHNPPEFNGVKCIAEDGLEASREFEEAIESAVERGVAAAVPFDRVGEVASDPQGGARYLDGILHQVDRARIAARKFSVVLDCANGAGAVTSPHLLRRLGCRVVTINGQVDGTFPGHFPEPTEANLEDLKRTVTAVGADLGVAHDGDADRAVYVDRNGRYVPGEEMLALLARDAVARNHGGVVVTAISAPRTVEDAIRPLHGTVEYTRVGSPAISRAMQRLRAVFGGEDNGGLIFPQFQLARDGAMSLAATLDLLARSDTGLPELLRELPQYAVVKEKIACPVADRDRVLGQVAAELERGAERTVTIDGLKVYRDGGWVLVRPSGTEPLLRVIAESKEPERARALSELALGAVRNALRAGT